MDKHGRKPSVIPTFGIRIGESMEEFDFNPDITFLFPEKPLCKAYMDISLRDTPWPIGYDTWFLSVSSQVQDCWIPTSRLA